MKPTILFFTVTCLWLIFFSTSSVDAQQRKRQQRPTQTVRLPAKAEVVIAETNGLVRKPNNSVVDKISGPISIEPNLTDCFKFRYSVELSPLGKSIVEKKGVLREELPFPVRGFRVTRVLKRTFLWGEYPEPPINALGMRQEYSGRMCIPSAGFKMVVERSLISGQVESVESHAKEMAYEIRYTGPIYLIEDVSIAHDSSSPVFEIVNGPSDPLVFLLTPKGYKYVSGKGFVRTPNGKRYDFPP